LLDAPSIAEWEEIEWDPADDEGRILLR